MPELGIIAADLIGFFVALAAMLALFALWVPFAILGALLKPVPVVGTFIANSITGNLQTAMQSQAATLDRLTGIFRHFIWALVAPFPWILSHMLDAMHDTKNTANKAHEHATAAQSNAEAYAFNQVAVLQQETAAAEYLLDQQARTNYTTQQLQEAQDALRLESEIIGLRGQIANLSVTAGGVTAADLAALQGQLDSLVARDLGVAEAYTDAHVAPLQGEITGLQDQVLGIPAEILGTIDQVVPGMITGALAGTLVGSIPGLLSQVQALEAEATTCLEPLCDTVTPSAPQLGRYGNWLKGLEALGIDAFFIALIAEAVASPGTVARDIEAVIEPLASPVLAGYRDLVGI